MECKHSSGVTQRLARIAGQVNGIRDMVEEGRPCDDLLVQLSSASSALTQVARLIMAEHLEHCVLAGFETGDRETTVENLKKSAGAIFKNEIAKGRGTPRPFCVPPSGTLCLLACDGFLQPLAPGGMLLLGGRIRLRG